MHTVGDIKGALLQKIESHTAKVGVVGLGYVGLPLAVEIARKGFHVQGIEPNKERTEKVNRGESFIPDVDSQDLKKLVDQGRLEAVIDYQRASELDVIVISVPTPLTANLTPNLIHVEKVCRKLSKHMRTGQFIALESTTYPGTTDEVMLPILQKSGLKVEHDFFVVHSPERVDPGNPNFATKNTNKVLGGVGPHSHEIGCIFYSQFIDHIVPVSSAKAAEFVKVYENTFRAVNIALVNELALLCDKMELNAWEVLDAAFTKPFGIMSFYPGPGVGGHCIPFDPHYLEWKAKEFNFDTHFITLAGQTNRKMPGFVREKVFRVLNNLGIAPSRAKILILGVAYKKDIGDCRESPVLEVLRLLNRDGVNLVYHDPHVPLLKDPEFKLEGQPLTAELIGEQDLTLITTDHSGIDYEWVVELSRSVVDTRNVTKHVTKGRDKITLL